jgi:HSP20 family molecular chaperone IbpA
MFHFEKYYFDQATIYPGCYTPINDSEKKWERLLKKAKPKAINPPVRITQLADHYRIQLFLPGFNREELMIHTQDHLVSIVGMRISYREAQVPNKKANSSKLRYVKEIELPDDVDAEFASADYSDNVLSIHLFKANSPVRNGSANIPVY